MSLTLLWLACRLQYLHELSRNWIRPEDLDARIEEALDNPHMLFGGEEEEYATADEDELDALRAKYPANR